MISVQNHRLLSSGNKLLTFLGVAALMAACSPKIRTTPPAPAQQAVPIPKPVEKPAVKPAAPKVYTVSMLLPFELDRLNSAAGYSSAHLQKAYIALDYYQGFKLALDSLTGKGYNYRLQVYDSKDEPAEARNLAQNPKVKYSDLIVGPIFPDDLGAFVDAMYSVRKPIVSPLSPAAPVNFDSNNLITATPPLEYHALSTAHYINDRIKPKNVIVLKSGFSEENKYIIPFKRAIDSLSKFKTKVTVVTVVRGNLSALMPKLSKTEQNVFVMPSTNHAFLVVTLRSLEALSKQYPVTLFGHPNWEKFTFLHAQQLQQLNTHITSAERINYKSGQTAAFVRAYRKQYHTEPSLYAIKGFDQGYYFGSLLAEKPSAFPDTAAADYHGISNSFHFIKKRRQGWINEHVNMFKYVNFELKQVE